MNKEVNNKQISNRDIVQCIMIIAINRSMHINDRVSILCDPF